MSDFFYRVVPNMVYAGAYPGDSKPVMARQKLTRLLDLGVSIFINLMEATETGWDGRLFEPYDTILTDLAGQRGLSIVHHRVAVRDVSIPSTETMETILGMMQSAKKEKRTVYVFVAEALAEPAQWSVAFLSARGWTVKKR